jgi:hypothetical protein
MSAASNPICRSDPLPGPFVLRIPAIMEGPGSSIERREQSSAVDSEKGAIGFYGEA